MSNRYRVTISMPLDAPYDVEADSAEEAEDKALAIGYERLCHQCASHWNEGDIDVLETRLLKEADL